MVQSSVTANDIATVERWLQEYPELAHIRVRKRGQILILDSGPKNDPIPHTRLRRTPRGQWAVEMPSGSRWEATPFENPKLEPLLELVREAFGWMLTPIL